MRGSARHHVGPWISVLLAAAVASAVPTRAHASAAAPGDPFGRGPRPAAGLAASDVPNDAGRAIDLAWRRSPDDTLGGVRAYRVERAAAPGGPWSVVDSTNAGVAVFSDATVDRGREYFYRITAVGPAGATPALSVTGPVRSRSEWLNTTRWSVLVIVALFFAFVLTFIGSAQSGKRPFVRRIAGIDAIEEAIGRATEMGRPVLFLPGILDIDEIQTVAGLVILESVARITARYQTPLTVPVTYPIPFAVAEDMVRAGCVHAGHPEQFERNQVRFVSPEQFAYVAAVTGIMMRDRPAAHIYMGAFYGESLLLAETGFATGAIQVAGTANVHQLPFFVVACDHTLIGEELFAASAYLSGEPKLVGSLKGADAMKVAVILLIVVGCLLETFGVTGLTRWMATQ
jgi:hypothetical protein